MNCHHYEEFNTPEKFIENIIKKRGSYMFCMCYESKQRKRINHKSVPIIIGSLIDYKIRGREALLASRALWGAVILKGVLKMYPSFSTFDALSMHVRETKTNKTIEWYTYIDEDGLALSYNNKSVTWTYKHETHTGTHEWAQLLNKSNPFGTTVLPSEYIKMFDTILKYPYSMNDLKIRQIINGPSIINKYVSHDLNRRRKKKTAGCQKMSKAFESGSLYPALSKKSAYEAEAWDKSYPQVIDNTLHEGRSNKTAHFLLNVTRQSNAAIRNSPALSFSSDSAYYFCMLNTKDFKSAGTNQALADYVIMTEESNQKSLYAYLLDLYNNYKSTKAPSNEYVAILAINGFLVNIKMHFTLQTLLTVKRQFPHVTTQYHWPYVKFSTRACIPIKYSCEHDAFFSPAETINFNITYPEADMLSITAKELTLDALRKTAPSKSTVSINNIKGSVAMVTSSLHQQLMENSLGVTCYMNITQDQIDKLIDYAIISTGHDTSDFERDYAELVHEFNLDADRLRTPKTTDVKMAMNALYRLYPIDNLSMEYRKSAAGPPFVRDVADMNAIRDYTTMIFHRDNFKTPNIWNLKLRAAFGNPFGSCIEDGVVVDSEVLKHIPPIHYNACITVEFTYKTVKQPKDARFIPIDETNGAIKHETLIGCLISEHPAYVKNSKHSKILTSKIGDHYYYLVHFLPKKTNMYANLKIRSICSSNSITIVITGQNCVSFGVGSKVANAFGQKNVVSMATDKLRDTCWGITRDGKKVHAQIVYSEVSLIGRIPSGQLYDMFISDELAIGPNKTIIAPVNLVIHTLHPYTNLKIFDVKVDTLTNINGFDSQNLSNVSTSLRSEKVDARVLQMLGLHGFKIDMNCIEQSRPKIVVDQCDEDIPCKRQRTCKRDLDQMEANNDNESALITTAQTLVLKKAKIDKPEIENYDISDDDEDDDNDDDDLNYNKKETDTINPVEFANIFYDADSDDDDNIQNDFEPDNDDDDNDNETDED